MNTFSKAFDGLSGKLSKIYRNVNTFNYIDSIIVIMLIDLIDKLC